MTSFFSTFSRRTFLIYGVIIGLLGGYAWKLTQAKEQLDVVYLDCYNAINNLEAVASNERREILSELHQKEDLAKEDTSKYRSTRVQRIQSFCAENNNFFASELRRIAPLLPDYWVNTESKYGPRDSTLPSAKMIQSLSSLEDSLRFFSNGDTQIISTIDKIFDCYRLQSFETVLKDGAPIEKALAISILIFDLNSIADAILTRLNDQLPKINEWDIAAWIPMIRTENTCIRTGDYFVADLFANRYPILDEIEVLANGKVVPIESGIGKFRCVYKSPGNKKIQLEKIWRNPLTGESFSKQNEVTINICK